ncbi:MAG: dehydratase [Sulfobacillus acidophilus]|uniref:Dehydratase n=1 Tax=Sulfobacillus acidophilus TaxID=53633 RepID=A0A2T2WNM2_9FIRM|nr:MAG: dehydratase [Sulfobacillus acidophilus]
MGQLFEDILIGEQITTPARTITETDVVQFAQLTGDFNPLHTDHVYARHSSFKAPIAHGLLGLGIATGLVARLGIFDEATTAFLAIENWSFKHPIFFGDTIHVQITVLNKRDTKDGKHGIVYRQLNVINHRDELVQTGVFVAMIKKRI